MKWRWDVTGKYLFSMVVMAPVLMAAVAGLEYNWLSGAKAWAMTKLRKCKDSHEDVENKDEAVEDEDVAAERARIENCEKAGITVEPLMVKRLKKFFGQSRPAVDNLTFGVDTSECFGLLGKTEMLSMKHM